MTRRPVLPGAAELFRRTDTPPAPEVTQLPDLASTTSSPALRGARRAEDAGPGPAGQPLTLLPGGAAPDDDADALGAYRGPAPALPSIPTRGRPAKRTQRAKHDEKITVYISADELVALETARLTLRAQHGVAADRGRIVREAISVLLADLEQQGADSVLVRRLGRG